MKRLFKTCHGGKTTWTTQQHVIFMQYSERQIPPFPPPFSKCIISMFRIYLHHGPQLWEVEYQPGKVTGISYLPHDYLSNCSSFSHLQSLMGAGGAGVRHRDPPHSYNPQCLSRLLIHACVKHMVSLHTSPFPLHVFSWPSCSTCQLICSSGDDED